MTTLLRDLIPHMAALLVGGLVSSFGLTALARRPSGRVVLGRIKVWGVAVFSVVAVGGLLGGFYWLFLGIRAGLDADATVGSPLSYLLFGLVTVQPTLMVYTMAYMVDWFQSIGLSLLQNPG